MPFYRLLLRTHHITSRSKVQKLSRAAVVHRVSVLVKRAARPPGIMICEGDSESEARAWLAVVKGLRYKGYYYVKGETLPGQRKINGGRDGLRAVDGSEEFLEELERFDDAANEHGHSIKAWWRDAMGF